MIDNKKPEPRHKPTVTDDLLVRLNSTLGKPLGIPVSVAETCEPATPEQPAAPTKYGTGIDAQLAELKEILKNLPIAQEIENPPIDLTTLQAERETQFTADIQAIVDSFNEALDSWYKRSDCVVNFGWNYGHFKKLEILGIDRILYRKPPPSSQTLREIIATGTP